MSAKKKLLADLLFAVQIVFAFVLGVSQFLRMLETIQGVSLTMFFSMEIFVGINLFLAIRAHRNQPSRITRQTMASYTLIIVMITADLAAIFIHGGYDWSRNDAITAVLVAVGIAVCLSGARLKGLGWGDPLVKGWLAISFKAIPQLLLAWKIFQDGGAGTPGAAILAGHFTVCTRLGQLGLSIREAGWDRNRIGSALSEIANEASWVVVTIVWLMR